MALIYLSIGFFYKDKIKQLSEFESRKYDLAAGAVAVALVIFCWFIYTDGNRLYYFDMKPVYYKELISAALIPCAFGMVFARIIYWMEKINWLDGLNRFFALCGQATIPIMFMHIPLNHWKDAFEYGRVMYVVIGIGCGAAIFGSQDDSMETLPLSAEVEAYEPVIRKYAKQYGIPDYVLLIQAVMMQESGGRGNDPMQASECGYNTQYPRTPGGITDPEYSIAVGIQNLADCLQTAGAESPIDLEHIQLALQGYNFGSGYITWALQKYGEYSRANAVEFSMKMAEQMGWNSYGDKQYVPRVLRYYPIGKVFYTPEDGDAIVDVALTQVGNVGGEPYWSWYGFTSRVEWCACFVSWCADQCGYLDSGAYPKFSGCVFGMQWFQQRGLWLDGSAEPVPGMLIFFDWATQDGVPDHVGIVERVENNVVYTVEGNSMDMCRQKQYSLGSSVILGYGMPAS